MPGPSEILSEKGREDGSDAVFPAARTNGAQRRRYPCGSGLDPELTSEGREMAQAFVKAYREAEWRAVYSSSLRRGITTAQPFCDALGIELQVRAELNEIGYGRWEGLTKEKVSQQYHDEYIAGWLTRPGMRQPEEN
jgi:broad specificity phosphatase PhoE